MRVMVVPDGEVRIDEPQPELDRRLTEVRIWVRRVRLVASRPIRRADLGQRRRCEQSIAPDGWRLRGIGVG
jgi:hypothetical protein